MPSLVFEDFDVADNPSVSNGSAPGNSVLVALAFSGTYTLFDTTADFALFDGTHTIAPQVNPNP